MGYARISRHLIQSTCSAHDDPIHSHVRLVLYVQAILTWPRVCFEHRTSLTDEVDPYKKPKELLDLSPKGLVPALRLDDYTPPRALNESTVIMDFLEEFVSTSHPADTSIFTLTSFFRLASHPERPNEPSFRSSPIHVRTRNRCASLRADHHHVVLDARALVRLQSDHINRTLVPAFYRYLQAQDPAAQISSGKEFRAAIDTLVALFERADREVFGTGLWNERGELGWADIMVGPCESCFELPTDDLRLMMSTCVCARSNYLIGMFRANNVLKRYRGFEMPEGAKFNAWLNRLFEHPAFKSTCSTDELYLDSYERRARSRSSVFVHLAHLPYRYAFNRPNTSQVANAINSGKGLP